MIDVLKQLTVIPTVSGRENGFDQLNRLFGDKFTYTKESPLGSFIGYIDNGKEKTVMLDAHMDEVGFMVTQICEGGFLKVTDIGKIDYCVLSGSEVLIYGKQTIDGIFTSKPPHLQEAGESKKKLSIDDFYIDTGLTDNELKQIVQVGTTVGFKGQIQQLQNNFIAGKGLDDKLGIAVIMRALELCSQPKYNIAASFSVCEETAYKGASTSAFAIAPHCAIAVDVTHAYIPSAPEWRKGINSCDGASICFSAQTSKRLSQFAIVTAQKNGINHQFLANPNKTGSNSNAIQISRSGIPTVLISIPLKNMHTASEIAYLPDAEECAKLIAAILTEDGLC